MFIARLNAVAIFRQIFSLPRNEYQIGLVTKFRAIKNIYEMEKRSSARKRYK